MNKSEYYVIKTSDGFGKYSYHIMSSSDKVTTYYQEHGDKYGIVDIIVYGPLLMDDKESVDFSAGTSIRDFVMY